MADNYKRQLQNHKQNESYNRSESENDHPHGGATEEENDDEMSEQ